MNRLAQALALIALFSACGRIELGSYGRDGDGQTAAGQPIDPGAGATGTTPSGGGSAASAGRASGLVGGRAGTATGGYWDQPSEAGGSVGSGGTPTADNGGSGAAGMTGGADLGGGGVAGGAGRGDAATAGGDDGAGLGGAGAAGDDGHGGGSAGKLGSGAGSAGNGGVLGKFKSCSSLPDICGGYPQKSCCAVDRVPAGEFIVGGLDQSVDNAVRSHVSALDLGEFEVTVGRFRAFLDAYDAWRASGAPRAGAGRHALIPGSGWDPGWFRQPNDPPDRSGLGADRAEIEAQVMSCLNTPLATDNWLQPANCVSFFEAEAFCIWDGGRLPTDLEWEYAAAGGDENRTYPWGSTEPTHNYAMYGCLGVPDFKCMIPAVGSYPLGRGRFGQLDLAGSVEEWTLDSIGIARPIPCNDCASVQQIYPTNPRVVRGGSWESDEDSLRVATSRTMEAPLHLFMFGFRCAYDVP